MRMFRSLLCAICLVIRSSIASSPSDGLVVDLGYARYLGHVNPDTQNTEFLGIRFAASPTGTLRWSAPQLPAHMNDTQIANTLPNRCISTSSPGLSNVSPFKFGFNISTDNQRPVATRATIEIPPTSEDCLFLNVYTPGTLGHKKDDKALPVVVWIHGGGYSRGSASGISNTDFFDGNDLIAEAGGKIVAVIIQYRLGLFGFLPGSEVKNNGVLNAGMMDQEMALRWVQQHIAKFNGDPKRVALWGQSAGAGSSVQHMVANGGNTTPKLFDTIITSSTFFPSQYDFDDPLSEQLFAEVVKHTGCTPTLECLRQTPVDVLTQVNDGLSLSAFFGTFLFTPVVDGMFMTKRITQLLQDGKFNGVTTIRSNTNAFEGIHFTNPALNSTLPEYVANLFPKFGEIQIAQATQLYSRLGPTVLSQAVSLIGESILICPTYFLLKTFNGHAFKSEFAIPPADHITDVVYYFPSEGSGPPFNNTLFDAAFSSSFLNFATSLDPNPLSVGLSPSSTTAETLPHWPKWDTKNMNEMKFNKTDTDEPMITVVKTDQMLLKRCQFWESVSALTGQ